MSLKYSFAFLHFQKMSQNLTQHPAWNILKIVFVLVKHE